VQLDDLIVYFRGEFVPYGSAKLGLLTHALQYGTGCFEGIRAFWNADAEQLYVFEPLAHYRRLRRSAGVLLMSPVPSPQRLSEVTAELCRRNGFRSDVYIRPFIFKSDETFGIRLDGIGDDLAIVAFSNDRYFDNDDGQRLCVSSWRRIDDNAVPARAKVTGSYVNVALAKSEARLNGFDDAIVLGEDGHISEASAANAFLVRDGVVTTPGVSQNLLEGITRALIARLISQELGLTLDERQVDRSELYGADEIVLCGTGVGVAWVKSIDHRPVGDGRLGPVASRLRTLYDDITRGRLTIPGVEARAVYPSAAQLAQRVAQLPHADANFARGRYAEAEHEAARP